jgi:hypothetical protein
MSSPRSLCQIICLIEEFVVKIKVLIDIRKWINKNNFIFWLTIDDKNEFLINVSNRK